MYAIRSYYGFRRIDADQAYMAVIFEDHGITVDHFFDGGLFVVMTGATRVLDGIVLRRGIVDR